MRTWLIGFSWAADTKTGFGNAFITHEDDSIITQSEIRDFEKQVTQNGIFLADAGETANSIVILSISEIGV